MKEDEWKTGRKWAYTRINPFVFNCIICSFKLSLRNANHSKRKREKKYPWSREQRESKNLQSFVQRNEILRGAEIEHSLKQSGWFSVSNFIVRPFTGCSSFESCPSDLIRLFVSKWVRERERERERESESERERESSWSNNFTKLETGREGKVFLEVFRLIILYLWDASTADWLGNFTETKSDECQFAEKEGKR